MVNLLHMEKWDELEPGIREDFRLLDLDFYYELWFQCKMLCDNEKDAVDLYKKMYEKL